MGISALKHKTLPGGTCWLLDFREISETKERKMGTSYSRLKRRKERVLIIFFSVVTVQ